MSSRSYQDLRAIRDRAAAQLLQIPGVHVVAIGGREKQGRPTGEVVLKVPMVHGRNAPDAMLASDVAAGVRAGSSSAARSIVGAPAVNIRSASTAKTVPLSPLPIDSMSPTCAPADIGVN